MCSISAGRPLRCGDAACRLAAALIAGLLLFSWPAWTEAAGTWSYTITPTDTPETIDPAATHAVVDTDLREIRLPRNAANTVDFWPDGGPDYIVASGGGVLHFQWDGSQMVENAILSIPLSASPLAIAAPLPLPDVAVVTTGPEGSEEIRRYSFDGSEMIRNPALEVAGLTGVLALSTRGGEDVAALAGEAVHHYQYDGQGMTRAPWLEPAGLSNPIALALRPDTLDLAVIDSDPATGGHRVRFFGFDGTGMSEIPFLAITGLAQAKAIAYGDSGDVAVVTGDQVRHYNFDGSGMVENTFLTVSDGVTYPSAVAVRSGSMDRIVADGNQVRYFTWDGSQLAEDPDRSVTVESALDLGRFAPSAVVQSFGHDPGVPADWVRVRADHLLEPGTQVTWFVSTDGQTWFPRWRVRASPEGDTACEITEDAGATWQGIGNLATCRIDENRPELWAEVPPGQDVRWRAELMTADGEVTPAIRTAPAGGTAVILEANARPDPPAALPGPDGCYGTAAPQFAWVFSDLDPGDSQTAYQLQVFRLADNVDEDLAIYDSGKLPGVAPSTSVPASEDPATPGYLWSSGTYQFTWRVRVWDTYVHTSAWSEPEPFCVIALERLRIAEIVAPPGEQVSPDPDDPTTHIVITPGMGVEDLPRARAGARVRILIDGIGPVTTFSAQFPYTDGDGNQREAALGDASPIWDSPPGSETNRWALDLWTEGRKDIVPNGTVVGADLQGETEQGPARLTSDTMPLYLTQGSIYDPFAVILWD